MGKINQKIIIHQCMFLKYLQINEQLEIDCHLLLNKVNNHDLN